MANKKNVTTLTLSTTLVDDCKRIYNTRNVSKAIINALEDFLLLPFAEQELNTFAIHQIIRNVENRKDTEKFSVRISQELHDAIRTLSKDNTLSEIATMMVSSTLYIASPKSAHAFSCPKLLHIWGNKWNPLMQEKLNIIKDTAKNVTWDTSVEVCAGGLGIHSNIKFANTEILNDRNWNIINLYRAVQENPRKLIVWARTLHVDEKTFSQQKTLFKNFTPSSSVDYDAAAC